MAGRYGSQVMTMTVTNTPSADLAFTNLAYCSSSDLRQFSGLRSLPRQRCRQLHSISLTVFAPRSFFGVEDYMDDDTSQPYTYQKFR